MSQRFAAVVVVCLSLICVEVAAAVDARTSWPVPHRAIGVRSIPQPVAYSQPKGNPGHDRDATPDGGAVYFYADAYEYVDATFVSGDYTQNQPLLGEESDYHSLADIDARSYDGSDGVEIGWIVSNTDPEPQLFVYHWVGGQPSCYNGCGYVQLSQTRVPGMHVEVSDTPQTYAIEYSDGDWYVGYQGEWIGYFPGSEWSDGFARIELVQWFGEVAASTRWPCSQMGSGAFADQAGAATISNLAVDDGVAESLLDQPNFPSAYSIAAATPTSFRYGGPGLCYDGLIFFDDFNFEARSDEMVAPIMRE